MMNRLIYTIFVLLLFSCSVKDKHKELTFKDVNESILCEAKKQLNSRSMDPIVPYFQPSVKSFEDDEVKCSKRKIDSIESEYKTPNAETLRALNFKKIVKYNQQNQLIYSKKYDDKRNYVHSLKYDQSGKMVLMIDNADTIRVGYPDNNTIEVSENQRKTMSYRDGLVVTDYEYLSPSIFEYKCVKTYDQKLRLIQYEAKFNNNSNGNYIKKYFYDDKGNVIKYIEITSEGTTTFLRKYNENGLVTNDSILFNNELKNNISYEYGLSNSINGIMISQRRLDLKSPDETEEVVVTFDDSGNWISQNVYVTGKNEIVLISEKYRNIYYR